MPSHLFNLPKLMSNIPDSTENNPPNWYTDNICTKHGGFSQTTGQYEPYEHVYTHSEIQLTHSKENNTAYWYTKMHVWSIVDSVKSPSLWAVLVYTQFEFQLTHSKENNPTNWYSNNTYTNHGEFIQTSDHCATYVFIASLQFLKSASPAWVITWLCTDSPLPDCYIVLLITSKHPTHSNTGTVTLAELSCTHSFPHNDPMHGFGDECVQYYSQPQSCTHV